MVVHAAWYADKSNSSHQFLNFGQAIILTDPDYVQLKKLRLLGKGSDFELVT